MKKIGILGGTFNPIHKGHIYIAKEATKILKLDKILFIPAGIPVHKKRDIINAEKRYNMVKNKIKRYKKFFVCDYEIKKKTPSYSIDTVKYLKKKFGKDTILFFIIGADTLLEIKTWKRWKELMKLCKFIVVKRKGYDISKVRLNYEILNAKPIDISSTQIRQNLMGVRS